MRLTPAFAVSILLATPLAAATLTVGPGGAFAEIADAVAAAQPGDDILVEPGTYQGFAVDKPLRIFGTGPGVIVSDLGGYSIELRNIAAGQEVVVSGLEVQAQAVIVSPSAGVLVENCEGTVVLNDLQVVPFQAAYGVHATHCSRLMVLSSRVENQGSAAALAAFGSEVWLANSIVVGEAGSFGISGEGPDGVSLEDSTFHVWRSTILGGNGTGGKPAFLVPPHGGDGLRADNSEVVLYGGPEGQIVGGSGGPAGLFAAAGDGGPGVRLINGSDARIQQDLPIVGGVDGTGLIPAANVVTAGGSSATFEARVFPTLKSNADGVSPGVPFQVDADGNPAAVVVLFLSLQTGPTLTIPGVEGLGALQPTLFFQLGAGVLDAGGGASFPLAVPPGATFVGQTLVFQAAEAGLAGLAITNPVAVAVR